jgi:DNA-3-methyladenine glycosylase I
MSIFSEAAEGHWLNQRNYGVWRPFLRQVYHSGMDKPRCHWVGSNPQMITYHDTEWGVPCRDDHKLFEFLVLDTFQAGLSWQGILLKREGLRVAFAGFNPAAVAEFADNDVDRLMHDSAIIRNRAKILATINNAKVYLKIQENNGSFADYFWGFNKGKTTLNKFITEQEIPAITPLSESISQAMKSDGFQFVGPTTIYAYMQGIGMVNDHLISCFRYNEIASI